MNSVFDKPVEVEVQELSEGIAIVIDGDTAPRAIASGQFLYIKNHSTLPTGGYNATAAIASGDSISSSNVIIDADGIANAIKGNIDALNSKLITENISNPINLASGATSVSSNAYKTGNVVQLTFQATFASLSNGTNILSSIVDSIKPKMRTIVSVFDYNTGKPLNGTLWISNASIYYYGDSLTNKTIIIVATYLTE